MSADALRRLQRNDRAMIRWICGVKPSDDISTVDLHAKLGLRDIADAFRVRRLRWFGHVERHGEKEIHRVRSITVPGVNRRGRPKKTWDQCVTKDLEKLGLKKSDALDKDKWNGTLRNSRLAPTPSSGSAPQGK